MCCSCRCYAHTPLSTIRAWEAVRIVDHAAPYLSKAFVDAHFAFHGRAIGGQQRQPERWNAPSLQ
ncbi:hypothetical protein [Edaphobacter sp.]|uniref:hypothetical protein n=1 Tax=Edaphobacter sp. TaxID=1934404 RepID=UPI00345C42AF